VITEGGNQRGVITQIVVSVQGSASLHAVLQRVKIPAEAIACKKSLCKNVDHSTELHAYANSITDVYITTANAA